MKPLHRAMSRRLLIRLASVASVAPCAGGAAEEPVQIYAAATFRTVLEKVLSAYRVTVAPPLLCMRPRQCSCSKLRRAP